MRRRSSADPSAEHRDADSTTDHSPAPTPAPAREHDDRPNHHHLEALQLKASHWTDPETWQHRALPSPVPQLPAARRPTHVPMAALAKDMMPPSPADRRTTKWRQRLRSPWACSLATLATTLAAFAALFLMAQSFLLRQQDVKGCGMSYMRPTYTRFSQFDTEHTRFATKYSLYLYREGSLDDDYDDFRARSLPSQTAITC